MTAAAPPAPQTPPDAALPDAAAPADAAGAADPAAALGALELDAPDATALAEALRPDRLRALSEQSWNWVQNELLTPDAALQIGLVALAIVTAIAISGPLISLADHLFRPVASRRFTPHARRIFESMARPVLMILLFLIAQTALAALEQPSYFLRFAVSLTLAWIVIRLATHVIREPFWARTVAVIVFTVAALNIFGLLAPTGAVLDSIGFSLGETRLSLLTLLRGMVLAVVLFWVAAALSGVARKRVDRLPSLTPSVRLLLSKTLQLLLMAIAFLLAISSFGINLTALAVFSGAVGLGIGFGLQKIFSNLVSGVILLLDRSIKPGDVIQVDETYGYVKTLGLRYSSIVTRDNHEHLIPNEEFIINKVVNWSFSDRAVRLKKKVGISYTSDVRLAQELMLEAAGAVERVLSHPKPVCQLNDFGDNSVVLEIRFWISDPQNGVNNVTSDVLFAIWDSFHERGVEFPFPQRDIHLRASDPLLVRLASDEEWKAAKTPAAPHEADADAATRPGGPDADDSDSDGIEAPDD